MALFKTTPSFDFLGKRKSFMLASAVVVLLSVVLLMFPGPRYGIDFAGGTDVLIRVDPGVEIGELRDAAHDMGFTDAVVQRFGAGEGEFLLQTRQTSIMTDEERAQATAAIRAAFGEEANVEFPDASGDRFFVYLPLTAYDLDGVDDVDDFLDPMVLADQAAAIASRIQNALQSAGMPETATAAFGSAAERRFQVRVQGLQSTFQAGLTSALGERFLRIDRIETVGPRVGSQLRNDGIKSVLFALIGILLYIGLRFDLRFAPGAVAALVHDVLITLGILILLGEEINLTMVAAFLTIVGYSLNDTIVNFDRIRENLQSVGGKPKDLVELANRSLNECFSRTMLTSMTTFIAVFCIFIIGGDSVQSFALALMIGVVVGTYSSLFIATPIFLLTSEFLEERAAAREQLAAAIAQQGPQAS